MKKAIQLLPFFTVAVGAIWFVSAVTTPQAGVGQTRDEVPFDDLPAEATQIDFWVLRPTTAIAFTTDEESFESWVRRYQRPGLRRKAGPAVATVIEPDSGTPQDVVLEEALQYRWRKDDASLQLTYDRKTQRAYYYGHYR